MGNSIIARVFFQIVRNEKGVEELEVDIKGDDEDVHDMIHAAFSHTPETQAKNNLIQLLVTEGVGYLRNGPCPDDHKGKRPEQRKQEHGEAKVISLTPNSDGQSTNGPASSMATEDL